MFRVWFVLAGLIVLAALLACEKKNAPALRFSVKTFLSILFVMAAWVSPHMPGSYFPLLFAGLCFCLAGDALLAVPGKKAFLAGLVFFLVGHLWYAAAFFLISGFTSYTVLGLGLGVAAGAVVFKKLLPYLGKMKGPVAAYVAVITCMLAAAAGVLGDGNLAGTARVLVFSGALFFYVSDLFVAINRFVKERFLNRAVGLPLYYTAQFMLAFSVAWVG